MALYSNASVHNGEDTIEILNNILETCNITLIYLPTYSPELNSCEFCFNICKTYLKNHHRTSFIEGLAISLGKITHVDLFNVYMRCICNPVPE